MTFIIILLKLSIFKADRVQDIDEKVCVDVGNANYFSNTQKILPKMSIPIDPRQDTLCVAKTRPWRRKLIQVFSH